MAYEKTRNRTQYRYSGVYPWWRPDKKIFPYYRPFMRGAHWCIVVGHMWLNKQFSCRWYEKPCEITRIRHFFSLCETVKNVKNNTFIVKMLRELSVIMVKEWELYGNCSIHYSDVIMNAMASQITGVSIVYSAVSSGAYQRKHQSPRYWPLCGVFTYDRWIPRTKGQ